MRINPGIVTPTFRERRLPPDVRLSTGDRGFEGSNPKMFIARSLAYNSMEYALVLLWFVVYQALAFAALPLAARLFPGFPDRGAAFALPVAMVVLTVVGYWVGHLGFGRWTAFLGVAVLVGLSGLVLRRDLSRRSDTENPDRSAGLIEGVTLPIRPYAETTLVFAAAFGLLVAVRAVDPGLYPGGGEKFLDFGIYKSLLRAEVLPPQDMWWAGEHVLYYYGGHLASALLTHIAGTEAQYAYNLALSGFYATLVTAAYGLAGAMADARGASRRVGAAFGAFFVGFGANLVTAVTGLIWLLPDETAVGVADWVAGPIADSTSGDLLAKGLAEFGYWAPSRVIPGTINEFPLFAFLNGDLHGHMLSTPFLLLIGALGFAYYRSGPSALRRRRALVFGALPVVVGVLGIVNVWSFPTGLGVVWLAVLFAPADPLSLFPGVSTDDTAETVADGEGRTKSGGRTDGGERAESGERASPTGAAAESGGELLLGEARRIGGAFAATGVVAAAAVAWVAPFVFGILLRSATNRSIAFLPEQSSAVGLLLVHGAFLLVFAAFLWPRARAAFEVRPARVGVLSLAVVLFAWRLQYPVLVLVVPLLVVGWLLLRTVGSAQTEGDVGYETVLVVAGAGLVTLVEFLYVKDNAIGGRFNTVFKVYMQVWVLWATAAGAALASLVSSAGPADWRLSPSGLDRRGVMSGVAALLVVSTGLYGGLALGEHVASDSHRTGDPTLAGKAYVEDRHPGEAAAIEWLDDREGQPHIVEPPGREVYSWSSPAASLTGLPTVVGWVYQEGVYRGSEKAEMRASDADLIYTGTWADRAELLETYDVTYIYVGPSARDRYDDEDLRFGEYPGVEEAFREGDVVVYEVTEA
jgi:YYY domain-containing protein